MTSVGWAGLIVGFGAFLLGYTHFAVLLFQELIWAALLIVTALLITRLIEAAANWLFGTGHVTGRFATSVMGLSAARLNQFGIVAAGIGSFVVWAVVVGLIAAPFANDGVSLVDQMRPDLLLGQLSSLDISYRTVLTAIVILAAGVTVTRLIRGWVENRLLPATGLDIGVRTSITTGLGYAGVVIALLFAASALGIALDKITLVASALSVGIGFGLQSIIQNFVSGVILLIERPIKIGDWVSVSGAEGSVRRINVRATELAMPDGSVTIVPNSSFISANVQNSAGAGVAGRIELSLKVSGGPMPDEIQDGVRATVKGLDCIRSHPAPRLRLTDAADDAFGFTLQVYGEAGHSVSDVHGELIAVLASTLREKGWKAAIS